MESSSITGAILAGGPSTCISGTLKALLPWGGETLIERQIREMRKICSEIIVVTNTPKPFFQVLDPSVRLITDYFAGCGPLGGIHGALHLARNPLVWVAGCDMPFLSSEVAGRLIESQTETSQAVIPLLHGWPVMLHALYGKQCAQVAAQMLSSGEKTMESFLSRIRWLGVAADSWVGDPSVGQFDFEINRAEDYEFVRGDGITSFTVSRSSAPT